VILAACFAGIATFLFLRPAGRRLHPQGSHLSWRQVIQRVRERSPTSRRQRRAREVRSVADFCAALAAELRAGQPPSVAWSRLWGSTKLVSSSQAHAVGYRADIPSVLRAASTGLGHGGLERVAACWEVGENSGAGLAAALDRIAQSLQAEREISAEIDGQLAGSRATARLLAALPILALALGEALGADPLEILLTTGYGWLCLLLGVGLSVLGSRWIEQQIRSVTPWSDR